MPPSLDDLNRETDFDVDETIAMMVHTTSLEERITKRTSFDCFRGTDRRRTGICAGLRQSRTSVATLARDTPLTPGTSWSDPSEAVRFCLRPIQHRHGWSFRHFVLMSLGLGRMVSLSLRLLRSCSMLFVLRFLGLVPHAHKKGFPRDWQHHASGRCATDSVSALSVTHWWRSCQLADCRSADRCPSAQFYDVIHMASMFSRLTCQSGAWNRGNSPGFFWAGICFCCIVYAYSGCQT